MVHRTDPSVAVRALKSAAPYIRMYKGKIFVIKASGGVFGDPALARGLMEQVAILHQVGIRVVLMHGGGPQLTEIQQSLGLEPRIVAGRRVTDAKSIDVTSMVLNGLVNTQILGMCRELDIAAVGVSGVDAGLIRAHKRPPAIVEGQTVDYGFVGDIDLVGRGIGAPSCDRRHILTTVGKVGECHGRAGSRQAERGMPAKTAGGGTDNEGNVTIEPEDVRHWRPHGERGRTPRLMCPRCDRTPRICPPTYRSRSQRRGSRR